MKTRNPLPSLVGSCGFALACAGVIVACGSSNGGSNHSAANGGLGGNGGVTANGGTTTTEGGTTGEGGTINAAGTTSRTPDAGASAGGSSEAGGGNAEAGASAAAGAAGGAAIPCHISWTGAATGEADCGHNGVCQRNFLSIGATAPATTAPITAVQLIFVVETELAVGTFKAAGLEAVDSTVQTNDPGVSYDPQFDPTTHLLIGGTSMTLTLSSVEFSTDPNDVCSGVAHGSLDAVLRQTNGSNTLSLHADF